MIISNFLFMILGTDHLRDVFGHMGLSDKDIVALSGAHTLVSAQNTFNLSILSCLLKYKMVLQKIIFLYYRVGVTRNVLGMRELGQLIHLFSIIHILSKYCSK